MKNKISCILTKIINIIIVISSILFAPYHLLYNGVESNLLNIISLLFLSSILFIVGWVGLLRTNDPVNRYNPFTINRKWKNKMEYSMYEKPSQIFELDHPEKSDIRNKKIDTLLK